MGVSKLIGIEVLDSEEPDKFTEKDIDVICVVGLVLGAVSLVYGIIATIKGSNPYANVNIKALFAITWGVILFTASILGTYLAQVVGEIKSIKEGTRFEKSSPSASKNRYMIKKPSSGEINTLSTRTAMWQNMDGQVLVASEVLFEDCGERMYLLGLWNEDSPEEVTYKLTFDSLLDFYINLADSEEIETAEEKSKSLHMISVVSKYGMLCKEICSSIQDRMLNEELYSSNDIKRMADYWNK